MGCRCQTCGFGSDAAAMYLQIKVSMHMRQLGELRRVSLTLPMVKANPKVRRVPIDRSHAAAFQKLLSSFDEEDNVRRYRAEGSGHAVTLFVHGVHEVAMEVLSPAVSALLNNLSHRILQLDKFVRGNFILETLELDQVVA
ncbi:hypothetical protein DYB38_013812 [Aphanomyces astaci]|uniref:Uncharacterized protein n=1 Tax=Aphanomyces astaci TaxID=112090 RepID=A0A397DKT4_APHAT|nr:hypothetical protein DYB38_013812 [Aphanomyces astaci]